MNYDPCMHHSAESGYQNPANSVALAEYVVAKVEELYPNKEDGTVAIFGIDNSSTFMAAFVKMLRPEWVFVSGSKYTGNFKNYSTLPQIRAAIFVDDYLYTGAASKCLVGMLNEKGMSCDLVICSIQTYWGIDKSLTMVQQALPKFGVKILSLQ